eukprot:TRINITY_DN46418_c0_g1_i1.p1 TRINITY_DN46418_c0_g1~~TRINITY_DN46418_c0_g1_i1.p1  ORF type:complete len:357 (+),score=33.25 TRINITY_DN46418_c0_g1_i1:23-1072(+)
MAVHHVLLVSLLVGICPCQIRGDLVGAAILPHGDFACNPALLKGYNAESYAEAERLHKGSQEAGRIISRLQPDLIVLTTPHAIEVSNDIAVYANTEFISEDVLGRDINASYGDGAIGSGSIIGLRAKGHPKMAKIIQSSLEGGAIGATLLEGWQDVLPLPWRWGEVFPLRFVGNNDCAATAPATGVKLGAPLVVLSLPLSRHTESGHLADAFREAGQKLGRLFNQSSMRIAFVVSTDLSHRHWSNTSFGKSSHADEFDKRCGVWASTLKWSHLESQRAVVDDVYACGWLGLPLLHGILEETGDWNSSVTAQPVSPTYYGMMAAAFQRSHLLAGGSNGSHSASNTTLLYF